MVDGNRISSIADKRVRDFIKLNPYDGVYTLDHLAPETVVQSYIVTEQAKRVFQEVAEEVSKPPGGGRRPCLITGDRGVGKSHTMAVLKEVARKPSLAVGVPDMDVRRSLDRLGRKKTVVADVSCRASSEEQIRPLVFQSVAAACGGETEGWPSLEQWMDSVDTEEQVASLVARVPAGHELLVFIDDISENLLSYHNITKIIGDLEFLLALASASAQSPVFVVASFFENLLTPEGAGSKYHDVHLKVKDSRLFDLFKICRLSKENLFEIIGRNIIVKTEVQKRDLSSVYQELTRTVPFFNPGIDRFTAMYPVHPLVFQLSFYLHRYIKNFSLLNFIYHGANRILSTRSTGLITLELIFDLLQHEFRKIPDLRIAIQSYDTIQDKVIANLPVTGRFLARMIAKALFLISITEECDPTPEQVIGALLLTEFQGRAIRAEDVASILDQFETKAPQCIRKSVKDGLTSYHVVTIDHASIDSTVEAIREGEPAMAEKVRKVVFHTLAEMAQGLQLIRDGRNHSVSAEPILFQWRGTNRFGVACWGPKYDRILIPQSVRSSESPFTRLQQEPDWTPPAAGRSETGGRHFDWQIVILSPDGSGGSSEINLAMDGHPTLFVWDPAPMDPSEQASAERAAVFLSEEYRLRFADMPHEYAARRASAEAEMRRLVMDKYFRDGALRTWDRAEPLAGIGDPADFLPFASGMLKAILDSTFPFHPHFGETALDGVSLPDCAKFFSSRAPAQPQFVKIAAEVLAPMGLASNTKDGWEFLPDDESYLESPLVFDSSETVASHPAKIFTLSVFKSCFSLPPYGLQPSVADILLLGLVAGGKAKISRSSNPDAQALFRNNLTGEIDLDFFDSLQVPDERALPFAELFQWGFFLCNSNPDVSDQSTLSRRRLRQMLGDWLAEQERHPLESSIEDMPPDLQTIHVSRDVQSTRRSSAAMESAVRSIVQQQCTLEEGLTVLAQTFSNNHEAFRAVLSEVAGVREFLGWSSNFESVKAYVLSSDKPTDPVVEGLRLDLIGVIDRPSKLLSADNRALFQESFARFKELYSSHYQAAHDSQMSALDECGEFGAMQKTGFWRNLPLLTRVTFIEKSTVRAMHQLIHLIRDSECSYDVSRVLQESPICLCGFHLTGNRGIERSVARLLEMAARARNQYTEFFTSVKKTVVLELQKIPSLDDDTAREVIQLVNGDLDFPVSLNGVKLMNFILKRKVPSLKILPPPSLGMGSVFKRSTVQEHLTSMKKRVEESREGYFYLDSEDS